MYTKPELELTDFLRDLKKQGDVILPKGSKDDRKILERMINALYTFVENKGSKEITRLYRRYDKGRKIFSLYYQGIHVIFHVDYQDEITDHQVMYKPKDPTWLGKGSSLRVWDIPKCYQDYVKSWVAYLFDLYLGRFKIELDLDKPEMPIDVEKIFFKRLVELTNKPFVHIKEHLPLMEKMVDHLKYFVKHADRLVYKYDSRQHGSDVFEYCLEDMSDCSIVIIRNVDLHDWDTVYYGMFLYLNGEYVHVKYTTTNDPDFRPEKHVDVEYSKDGDHVVVQSKSAYQLSRVFYRLAKEILYSSITRIRT